MQQMPKAAEVESVESPILSGIGRPRLAAIKESKQDTSLVLLLNRSLFFLSFFFSFVLSLNTCLLSLAMTAAALAILKLTSASSEVELDTVSPSR